MENKKTKKTKTIHMRYPAPYSWSQTGSYERKPRTMKKSVSYDSKNKYTKSVPSKCCDPYAPHLKYGIFPRKNSKEVESSKISLSKTASEQLLSKEGHIKSPDEPYFIIRPLNKRHTKQLTVSEVLHVDIQPRLRKSPIRASSSVRFYKY